MGGKNAFFLLLSHVSAAVDLAERLFFSPFALIGALSNLFERARQSVRTLAVMLFNQVRKPLRKKKRKEKKKVKGRSRKGRFLVVLRVKKR